MKKRNNNHITISQTPFKPKTISDFGILSPSSFNQPKNEGREIKYASFMETKLEQIEKEKKADIERTNKFFGYYIIAFFISLLLAIIFQTEFFFMLGVGILFLAFIAKGISHFSSNRTEEINIIKSGIAGEKSFASVLKSVLPKNHFVIYNYPISHSDIDALVVGETGIYVFEVKNIKGYLTIDETGWKRQKVSAAGRVYEAKTGNYELQAKRNAMYIKNLLKENGINVWVDYYVVFTNDKLYLNINNEDKNLIHLRDLNKVFEERKKILNESQIEKILKILQNG